MADEPKTKRIRMVVHSDHPAVSDGIGGWHKSGECPTLPTEIADIFIGAKLAVEFGEAVTHEAKMAAAAVQTNQRALSVKELAEAVMKNHDDLSPEDRAAAYDRVYTDTDKDKTWEPNDSSITTPTPEKASGSSPTATTDSTSTTSKIAPPSSTTTLSSGTPVSTLGVPATISGKKRRSRTDS